MTDAEKAEHPHASACEGYLKACTYKEAWANFWSVLPDAKRNSFKTLPNFDPEVFKEITGIDIEVPES
jgi:hypothetical protein